MIAVDCTPLCIRPPQPRTDRHYFSGTVTLQGVPRPLQRMALLNRESLAVLAWARSRADGSYIFSGLPEYDPETLLVLCLDDEAECEALAHDYVSQCVRPLMSA